MRMKKFLLIGVLSLSTLVGCAATQKTVSGSVEESAVASPEVTVGESSQPAASDQVASTAPTASDETQTAKATATEETTPSSDEAATQQIQTLSGFIGKTAHDVNVALGQPNTSKHIENSKVLAANYYKVEFCNEIAKVEVDFDVDSQKVNYVSFTIIAADDIETSKNTFINVLTSLYGESTIERYLDVKGKQRRDWNDGTLDYDLKYYENNISLDIYPLDK